MKLRPLLLTPDTLAEVRRVVKYAEAHKLTVDDLKGIIAGTRKSPGDDDGHRCVLPVGYECVYTIECPEEYGWCRHLSVSAQGAGKGMAPGPPAMLMLMQAFGFTGGFDEMLCVYTEKFGKHDGTSVNVVQKIAAATPPGEGEVIALSA